MHPGASRSSSVSPPAPAQARRRLLIVCQPLEAGVPQHVLDLVYELPSEYEFELVCPRGSLLWRTFEGDERCTLHELGRGRRPGLSDLRPFVRLLKLSRRADVIHAHSSKAGFLARLAARLTGRRKRVVFTPHCWSFWAAQGRERQFYAMLERIAARWCRTIVAVSRFERDRGLDVAVGRPGQYVVIPNGIDVNRFAGDPEPVSGRILFVGRLAPQKRPALALETLAEIERRAPGVATLQLVGDGELRRELEDFAQRLEVGHAIEFLGERSDVPALLARAQCFLLTSDYEGCPISVLEAMAAGVPVVAAESGGLDEVVRQDVTGLLVPADPASLAQAVLELLRDPERAMRLGAEARRRARNEYRRAVPADRLHALYGEIITGAAAL